MRKPDKSLRTNQAWNPPEAVDSGDMAIGAASTLGNRNAGLDKDVSNRITNGGASWLQVKEAAFAGEISNDMAADTDLDAVSTDEDL